MAVINSSQIKQNLVLQMTNSRVLENLAYGAMLSKLSNRKRKLLKDFDKHDVTKEIYAGVDSPTSTFLERGNLNSFIGLYPGQGENQLTDVKQLLQDRIKLRKTPVSKRRTRNSVIWDFAYELPFLKEIWALTQYAGNWKPGISWADEIEARGIPHFDYYIFSLKAFKVVPQSRSGTALQLRFKGGTRPGKIPYIRKLLEDFANNFDAKKE